MKFITIKSLVSVSNVALYLLFILTFLSWGLYHLDLETIIKTDYFFIIFAFVLFALYHWLRRLELKKTDFQLTRRHIIWMYIFYCGQYLCLFIALLYIIIAKTKVLSSQGVQIYFEAGFPIVFIITSAISILESVIRAEERIFTYKKVWQESEQWNMEHSQDEKDENPFAEEGDGVAQIPSDDSTEQKKLFDDSREKDSHLTKSDDAKKDNPFA